VAHKVFSEVKKNMAFEEAPIVDKQRVYRKSHPGWAEWLRGVLIGTGLGMALQLAECLISGTTSVPAAKPDTEARPAVWA